MNRDETKDDVSDMLVRRGRKLTKTTYCSLVWKISTVVTSQVDSWQWTVQPSSRYSLDALDPPQSHPS